MEVTTSCCNGFTGPGTGAVASVGGRGLDASSDLQDTTAALDNKHNAEQRERYYATVRKPAQLQSPGLERIPGKTLVNAKKFHV